MSWAYNQSNHSPHFTPPLKEIMLSINHVKWEHAIQSELDSIHKNETWDLVPFWKDRNALPCKWVYKYKYTSDKTSPKYKAILQKLEMFPIVGSTYSIMISKSLWRFHDARIMQEHTKTNQKQCIDTLFDCLHLGKP